MSKKPTMIAYTVKERGDGQKAIWTRIGAAWPRLPLISSPPPRPPEQRRGHSTSSLGQSE